jgi:glucokinase
MESARVLALDLGGTDLKAALVTRGGELESFLHAPSRTRESPTATFEVLRDVVATLRARAAAPVVAIGLGAPGVIDPASGAQVGATAHLPHWRDVPLRAWLEERFGLPAAVDNDANAAALAESRLGAARGARVSMTVTLGTGIGCGIVVDGRVLHGAFGGAGEIGHLPIGSGEVPCRCGVACCVEPEASGSGLVRSARLRGLDAADAASVFDAAAGGDTVALELVDRMADRLGRLIATAINLLNPQVVAIGGGVAGAGEPLFSRLDRAVERYALASHRRGLSVVPAALGERAGTVGAGLLAWERAGNPG